MSDSLLAEIRLTTTNSDVYGPSEVIIRAGVYPVLMPIFLHCAASVELNVFHMLVSGQFRSG